MITRRFMLWPLISGALLVAACTVDQTKVPDLTGPSTFATSLSVSANPDFLAFGQSATTPGQQAVVLVSAFDATGQPKPNQTVRLEVVVKDLPSACGQLSTSSVTTGSDGRASVVFTAPSSCPFFDVDGTVGVRATPVGSNASISAASTARILMVLPATSTSATSPGGLTANLSVAALPGTRLFQFDGTSSVSPGHTIVRYLWTFSDGDVEVGSVIDHDFGTTGTYQVTLTVTDDIGQVSWKSALVTVS